MGVMGKAAGALGGATKGLLKGTTKAVGGVHRVVTSPRAGMGAMRTVASKLTGKRSMTSGRR